MLSHPSDDLRVHIIRLVHRKDALLSFPKGGTSCLPGLGWRATLRGKSEAAS